MSAIFDYLLKAGNGGSPGAAAKAAASKINSEALEQLQARLAQHTPQAKRYHASEEPETSQKQPRRYMCHLKKHTEVESAELESPEPVDGCPKAADEDEELEAFWDGFFSPEEPEGDSSDTTLVMSGRPQAYSPATKIAEKADGPMEDDSPRDQTQGKEEGNMAKAAAETPEAKLPHCESATPLGKWTAKADDKLPKAYARAVEKASIFEHVTAEDIVPRAKAELRKHLLPRNYTIKLQDGTVLEGTLRILVVKRAQRVEIAIRRHNTMPTQLSTVLLRRLPQEAWKLILVVKALSMACHLYEKGVQKDGLRWDSDAQAFEALLALTEHVRDWVAKQPAPAPNNPGGVTAV